MVDRRTTNRERRRDPITHLTIENILARYRANSSPLRDTAEIFAGKLIPLAIARRILLGAQRRSQ